MLHHIFGILAITNAVLAGYSNVGVSAMTLMVEISSVFLNYRILFEKSEQGKPLAMLMFGLFFVTYTVFRIVMLPYAMFKCYKTLVLTYNYVSTFRKIAYIFSMAIFFFLVILNYFWYYKVILLLKRVFLSKNKSSPRSSPVIEKLDEEIAERKANSSDILEQGRWNRL